MVFRGVLPPRKPCCTKRGGVTCEILACFDEGVGNLAVVSMMKWRILAVNAGGSFVFVAQIGYLGKPAAVGRYTALEPAYGFGLIEMCPSRQVRASISGHGLRERGLGSCSSRVSWSLPQCGHFNLLSVTGVSSFSF